MIACLRLLVQHQRRVPTDAGNAHTHRIAAPPTNTARGMHACIFVKIRASQTFRIRPTQKQTTSSIPSTIQRQHEKEKEIGTQACGRLSTFAPKMLTMSATRCNKRSITQVEDPFQKKTPSIDAPAQAIRPLLDARMPSLAHFELECSYRLKPE